MNEEDREEMRFDSYVELSPDNQKMKHLTKAEIVEKSLMTDYGKVEGKVKLNSTRVNVLHTNQPRLDIPVSQLQITPMCKDDKVLQRDYSKYYGREASSIQRARDIITRECWMITMKWWKNSL